MRNKFIQQTLQIAKQNPGFGNARIGAVLVYKNQIITTADNNNRKSHPITLEYGRNRHAIYPHAEVALLLNAERQGFDKWAKATIYVGRVIQQHGILLSAQVKPCDGCFKAIKEYGIGRVYWTLGNECYGLWERA